MCKLHETHALSDQYTGPNHIVCVVLLHDPIEASPGPCGIGPDEHRRSQVRRRGGGRQEVLRCRWSDCRAKQGPYLGMNNRAFGLQHMMTRAIAFGVFSVDDAELWAHEMTEMYRQHSAELIDELVSKLMHLRWLYERFKGTCNQVDAVVFGHASDFSVRKEVGEVVDVVPITGQFYEPAFHSVSLCVLT
jgi:hypothetical protein